MDSDDSDFYGDPQTTASLTARVESFDVAHWWSSHKSDGRLAAPQPRPTLPDSGTGASGSTQLHNPYAGYPYAWQLTEPIDTFLARLPPSTTDRSPETPWIYICNPYVPRRAKADSQNQRSRGNEDEAPEEAGSRLSQFVEGGEQRLSLLHDFVEKTRESRKAKGVVAREVNAEKKRAVEDLLNLAYECHIRPGKWMLFCSPADVDEVWEVVARATANNELGIAAKVAPRPEDEGKKERLICIYTADFRDTKDIARVLYKLRDLRLVESRGKPIYYKCDAFTYLGIAGGNPWELRASIYSSTDFLAKKAEEE